MPYEDLDNAVAAYKQSLDAKAQAVQTKSDAASALAQAQATYDEAATAETQAGQAASDAKDALVQTATDLLGA
jgi:hypothetical protein